MSDAVRLTEDDDFFQHAHRLMARLRAESPALRVSLYAEDHPGWLFTRYEDVKAATSGPAISRDWKAIHGLSREMDRKHAEATGTPVPDDPFADLGWDYAGILYLDPPAHTRLRKVAQKAFTPGAIERLRPRVEQIVDRLLDRLSGPGPVDLVPGLAQPLPLIVICELLGIPEADRPDFTWWAHVINGVVDGQEHLPAVLKACGNYLGELADRKAAAPGSDLMSEMARAEAVGLMSRGELIGMAVLMLVAGHDTTVGLLGNGILELLRAPSQLERLRSDPSLLPNAVDEMLRYASPVNISSTRITREPVEIGGAYLRAGEFVHVSVMSANRDPARFENPDVFDITRRPGGHLGFGHGIHYCLGAPLARLETEIVLGALLSRFPALRLAADPGTLTYRKSTLIHTPVALPVYLTG